MLTDDAMYNALFLVHAVDVVAEVIARTDVVFMPALKPQISRLLLEHFKSDLVSRLESPGSDLGAKGEADEIVSLAHALTGDDPLTLYLKDVIPAATTAGKIRTMADAAKRSPIEIFRALRVKLMSELRSLSPDEVKVGQALDDHTERGTGNDFPLQELVGEISAQFHAYVTGTKNTYAVTSELTIEKSAAERLAVVESLVTGEATADSKAPALNAADPIGAFLQQQFKLSPEGAGALRAQLLAYMRAVPAMMTLPHKRWFDDKGLTQSDTRYQSIIGLRQKQETASSIIRPGAATGSMTTLGRRGEGAMQDLLKARGEQYPQWRFDKDRRAEHEDIPATAFPVYGCLCYWRIPQWGAGGSNYYGGIHLMLKPEKRAGAKYKYTDQGEKYADVEDLLVQIIARNPIQAFAIIGEFLAADSYPIPRNNLEVILPGGIDIKADVQEVIPSKEVPSSTAVAIAKWCGDNRIRFRSETDAKQLNRSEAEMGVDALGPVKGFHDNQITTHMRRILDVNAQMAIVSLNEVLTLPTWRTQQKKKGLFQFGTEVPTGVGVLQEILKTDKPGRATLTKMIDEADRQLAPGNATSGAAKALYTFLASLRSTVLNHPAPDWDAIAVRIARVSALLAG